jgi:hypothetical protein
VNAGLLSHAPVPNAVLRMLRSRSSAASAALRLVRQLPSECLSHDQSKHGSSSVSDAI